MKRTYFVIGALIIAATFIGTLVLWPQLPDRVPTHWNAHNQVNGWSSKEWTALLMPGIMTVMLLVTAALPWLSPRNFEVETQGGGAYLPIMIAAIAFTAVVHFAVLEAALGHRFEITHVITGGVGLLFAAIGAMLPGVRRNFYVGVRTPWTLADPRVWEATHRFAGKALVIAGLLAVALAFLTATPWSAAVALAAGAMAPIIYSLAYYKQLERRGEV
ncbi:MAG TPA: DUF1648 domain-containing protein [Terriglobales bacterium]|nr:DUF1648 domain-containing protein [Terriglobales bacterium]